MKSIKKLLVLLALIAVMITALIVCTSAYISWDEETGTFPGGSKSSYADVNAPGWVQIGKEWGGVNNGSTDTQDEEGDLYGSGGNWRAFYNATTKTVVLETYNDGLLLGTWSGAENTKTNTAYWIKQNAANIEYLEIRNAGSVSALTYIVGSLANVKRIAIGDSVVKWSHDSQLKGLTSLESVRWGTWSKNTGEFSLTYGSDYTIDLRGIKQVSPSVNIWLDQNHFIVLPSQVNGTAAKKVILPTQYTAPDSATFNRVVVSDGTLTEGNPKVATAKTFSEGARVFVIQDAEGNLYYTENNWSLPDGWSKVMDKAVDTAPHYGDYAGIISWNFAAGATNLEEVVVPAGVVLKEIEPGAFNGCSALKLIDIKGSVSADMKVAKSAFTGVSDLVIKVGDEISKANMEAALAAAGVTGVTVQSGRTVVVADGYSIRYDDTNTTAKGPALRAEFTLNAELVSTAGTELDDFGAVLFAASTLEAYNGDVSAVLAAAMAGENTAKIKKVSAKKGPFVRVDDTTGDKTFAIAITGIPSVNYGSAIYTYAYTEWSDGSITYTTYTSERTGKTAHSLYDATVFAFRSGIVNSQNFNTGVDLWDILSNGAFTVKAGEEKAFADGLNLDVQYTLDAENDFTYLNLDLHAWILYKDSSGNVPWDGGGHSLEADNSSTNIVWSLLCDGNDLVAVYRKDPEATGDAVLPRIIDHAQYTAAAPFSPNYFKPGTGWGTFKGTVDAATMKNGDGATNGLYKQAAIYSPILSDANASKITTLVIDYGVNKIAPQSLGNKTVSSLTTIVYPEGVSAEGYIFANNQSVATVICAPVSEHILPAATQEKDFGNVIDLSGLDSMSLQYAFSGVVMAENIILPINNTTSTRTMYTFNGCTNLKRVWTIGDEVPAEGTINLTGSSTLKSFCRRAFEGVPASTILMPATFEGVGYSSMIMEQQDDSIRVFGTDVAHTIVLVNHKGLTAKFVQWNEGGLIAYQDKLHSLDNDNVDKIRVTCPIDGVEMTKTIAEWKAYFEANPVQ